MGVGGECATEEQQSPTGKKKEKLAIASSAL